MDRTFDLVFPMYFPAMPPRSPVMPNYFSRRQPDGHIEEPWPPNTLQMLLFY